MSETGHTALQAIAPQLRALAPDAIVEPRVRLHLLLRDATELLEIISQPSVRARLLQVGVVPELVDSLHVAIDALAQAQSQWLAARGKEMPAQLAEQELAGYDLRDEIVAACRFNLSERQAGPALARISDAEQPMDLVHDLMELADLLEQFEPRFQRDGSFSPSKCRERARELAEKIGEAAIQVSRASTERDLRDRAFTHLVEMVGHLRDAGRYAYRDSQSARQLFASNLVAARPRTDLGSVVRSRSA